MTFLNDQKFLDGTLTTRKQNNETFVNFFPSCFDTSSQEMAVKVDDMRFNVGFWEISYMKIINSSVYKVKKIDDSDIMHEC